MPEHRHCGGVAEPRGGALAPVNGAKARKAWIFWRVSRLKTKDGRSEILKKLHFQMFFFFFMICLWRFLLEQYHNIISPIDLIWTHCLPPKLP